jgi:L-methionine (R)-S-oxide reductase
MGDINGPLARLHDLSFFLQAQGSLEEGLKQMAGMAAKLLNAASCSIMLLDERDEQDVRLRVFAAHGELPEAAFRQITRKGEGIAGHVLASGKPLLVEDISQSEFIQAARHLTRGAKSLVSAPILIDARIIGVINATDPKTRPAFTLDDLNLLDVAALFIGKSVQVQQLQGLLNSRFAQMALAQEAQTMVGGAMAAMSQNPNQMAKILAKSFFKEMTRAGFSATQIIHAASEIITQLNASLGKHSKRLERK